MQIEVRKVDAHPQRPQRMGHVRRHPVRGRRVRQNAEVTQLRRQSLLPARRGTSSLVKRVRVTVCIWTQIGVRKDQVHCPTARQMVMRSIMVQHLTHEECHLHVNMVPVHRLQQS